jgi:hypothetical protein
MSRIIRGSPTVSTYKDPNGNFRALNANHLGFVGYGRTAEETIKNLNENIGRRPASPREQIAALFMMLGKDEQRATLEELPTLSRS